MDSPVPALYYILTNDADVSALVSDSIFPERIPQGKNYPCVVYRIISDLPTNSKDTKSDLDWYRVEITAWSTTYTECEDLAKKIRDALDFQSGSFNGVNINSCRFDGLVDRFDDKGEVFSKSNDYIFIIKT